MASTPLQDLKNLGPTIIKRLEDVGIYTKADLQNVGPAPAYKLMQKKSPKHLHVCYYLYSLEGALKNVHWDDLSDKKKQALLREIK